MKLTVKRIENDYIYTEEKQTLWGLDVQVGDVLDATMDEWGVITKVTKDGIVLYEEV